MKVLKPLGIVAAALAIYYGVQILYSFAVSFMAILFAGASVEAMTAYIYEQALLISAVSTVVTLTIYFLYPVARRQNPFPYFSFQKIPLYTPPLLVLFGLAGSFTVNLIWTILPFPEEMWDIYNESMDSMLGGEPVLTFVVLVIFAPLLEEILFRSILLKQFARFMPKFLALILSSLIFAVAHGNLIQGSYAFACGLLLGFIFLRYRSVLASMLFHLGFNASSYIAELFPESSYFIVCLYSILIFVTLFVLMIVTTRNKTLPADSESEALSQ